MVKTIDYARMQKVYPKQKAALTRAVKSGQYDKVVKACRDAVREWDEIGAWPDDWARWQRALDDAAFKDPINSLNGLRLEDFWRGE